jgi:hypothetical protein
MMRGIWGTNVSGVFDSIYTRAHTHTHTHEGIIIISLCVCDLFFHGFGTLL